MKLTKDVKLTPTNKGKALIEATLYHRQKWYPGGLITGDGPTLKFATTQFLGELVIVDFVHDTISINAKKPKMRREVIKDLISVVKLKLTKKLKNGKTKRNLKIR